MNRDGKQIEQERPEQPEQPDRREFVKRQVAAGFAMAIPTIPSIGPSNSSGNQPLTGNQKETSKVRVPRKIIPARPHVEGAGVHLHRGFGFGENGGL